jgi:hypothetical protein
MTQAIKCAETGERSASSRLDPHGGDGHDLYDSAGNPG